MDHIAQLLVYNHNGDTVALGLSQSQLFIGTR